MNEELFLFSVLSFRMSLSISTDQSHFHQYFYFRKILKEFFNELNGIIQKQKELIEDLIRYESEIKQLNREIYQTKSFQYFFKEIICKIFQLKDQLNVLIENLNQNEEFYDQIRNEIVDLFSNSNEIIKYEINLKKQTSFYPNLLNPIRELDLLIKSKCLLSTNEKYFLINTNSSLYLYNIDYQLMKRLSLNTNIHDICWSSTLNHFYLISSHDFFQFDLHSMSIKLMKINYKDHSNWHRICFSPNHLFLTKFEKNSCLYQFHLFPTIQFFKKYRNEIYSNRNQFLNDLKYFDKNLYLLIEDNLINKSFLQIYLLKTFHLLQRISLGKGWNYRLCLFNNQYWIISDHYNQRLIFIDFNGNLLKIESFPMKINEMVGWIDQQLIIQSNEKVIIYQSY